MVEEVNPERRQDAEDLLEKSKEVFSIFCDHFGEDRCDLKLSKLAIDELNAGMPVGSIRLNSMNNYAVCYILIYFPEVEIRNERDFTHTIRELYVKINLSEKGTMFGHFCMLRTKYSMNELVAGYLHSHAYYVTPAALRTKSFQSCCLGNGPIAATSSELVRESDPDRWSIFCFQLEQYVGIESLHGGPYVKIEKIENECSASNLLYVYDWKAIRRISARPTIRPEIVYKFFLNTEIDLIRQDHMWVPKMSALEMATRLAPLLEEAGQTGFLVKGVLSGTKLYNSGRESENALASFNGQLMLTFKGVEKHLAIDDIREESRPTVTLAVPSYLLVLLRAILTYTNILKNDKEYDTNRKFKVLSYN